MNKIYILLFLFVILLSFLSYPKFDFEHTSVDLSIIRYSKDCSPLVHVHIKKFGIENVISSCLIQKEPLYARCVGEKLKSDVNLEPICLDANFTGEVLWVVSLYGKHTFFDYPKFELINETLK